MQNKEEEKALLESDVDREAKDIPIVDSPTPWHPPVNPDEEEEDPDEEVGPAH